MVITFYCYLEENLEANAGVGAESPAGGIFSDAQKKDELKCKKSESENHIDDDMHDEAAADVEAKSDRIVYFYQVKSGSLLSICH